MLARQLAQPLAIALGVYLVVMLAIGFWARGKIDTHEDFLVAGRRLPLLLAWPTLLATWFGAGTLLTATDEVRAEGLRKAALDPIGAGLCLILAGLWLARPLWRAKLCTLSDFFRVRFGRRAEVASALLMVPTYFGWIAAQFVALAGLLELAFGIPMTAGVAIVAGVGTAYTLLGGMWSVTATDAIQIVLVAIGLLVLTAEVLTTLGGSWSGGLAALVDGLPESRRVLVPTESGAAFVGWVGVLAIGALGNLPGQDLLQRVFASRSERTAVWACHLAGLSYVVLGALPLILGLAASVLRPDVSADTSTLTLLASVFLSPTAAVIFLVALTSAVLSTVDSAILSPASVLSENLLKGWGPLARFSPVSLARIAVLGVAAGACAVAYAGQDAYELLEGAYELGLVSLLVPLLAGVKTTRGGQTAALAAMATGTGVWLVHVIVGAPGFVGAEAVPLGLSCAGLAAIAYALAARSDARTRP